MNKFTIEYAKSLDASSSMKNFRDEFLFPEDSNKNSYIYLCGHSLGLQPKNTKQYLLQECEKWQKKAVLGHFSDPDSWVDYHMLTQPTLAKLVGATTDSVNAMNTLTVNLHLLLATFYKPNKKKYKILIEDSAFPSDRYALQSHITWNKYSPQETLVTLTNDENNLFSLEKLKSILAKHGEEISILWLPAVQFLTGEVYPIKQITKLAHQYDILVGLDLAHAIGNIPLNLEKDDVDFAIWCSYKYLNAGPGAIAGIYVHPKHFAKYTPALTGWWGHDKSTRFKMPEQFKSIGNIEGFQLSNPCILSLCALRASLSIFEKTGYMDKLYLKTQQLSEYAINCLQESLKNTVEIISPLNKNQRGAQLSIRLNHSIDIELKILYNKLISRGIVVDIRPPDIMRISFIGLYNNHQDVFCFTKQLQEALRR